MIGSGLGESQQRILEHLKRSGSGTIPVIAGDVGLNVETVRAHLRALDRDGLVKRAGSRPRGPGRPEIVYELTSDAERLFPNREGELFQRFAAYLEESGHPGLVGEFFDDYVDSRRTEALARVAGLEGEDRLHEVARILSEEGFMAEVDRDGEGRPLLKLPNCPIRKLVSATRAPCRAELGFVRELLGEKLTRVSYIPSGDSACCYALREE
jgi:DeoR family transcriptional regulator, suf operon transcriptional repressor